MPYKKKQITGKAEGLLGDNPVEVRVLSAALFGLTSSSDDLGAGAA
jgi:hypothetical protein